jgi:hypothetical protein
MGADESRENVKRPFIIHSIKEPLGSGDFIISFDHLLVTTRIPRRPSNICSLPTRARELHSPGFQSKPPKLSVYLTQGVIHRLDHAPQFVRHGLAVDASQEKMPPSRPACLSAHFDGTNGDASLMVSVQYRRRDAAYG